MPMLLKHDMQINWSLNIHLYFDDETEKSVEIKPEMYLLLKFRRNGNIYNKAGRVEMVNPVMLDTQPISYTGSIIMDFAGRFRSSNIRIPAKDILDIRVVSKAQIENLIHNYEITDNLFNPSVVIPDIPQIPENPDISDFPKEDDNDIDSGIDSGKIGLMKIY